MHYEGSPHRAIGLAYRTAPLTRDGRRDGSDEEHGEVQVRDRTSASRYEAVMDGETVGILQYKRLRDRIKLIHTVTDPAKRGTGAASALVRTAFAEARRDGISVDPICPFVESWLNRHPEEADIVIGQNR